MNRKDRENKYKRRTHKHNLNDKSCHILIFQCLYINEMERN